MNEIRLIVGTLMALALTPVANAANYEWQGGQSNSWQDAANWKPNTGSPGKGDAAVLTARQSAGTIELKADTSLRSLMFDHGALHALMLTGKSLSLGDGSSVTFAKLPGDVGMGKSASATISSELNLTGRVTFANMNRHYLGGEKLAVRGAISGGGSIVIAGTKHGIVQLFGDNVKYKGAFTIETGSLMLSHDNALGTGKQPVTLNGGAIVMGARVSTTHNFLITADAEWDAHGPNGNHDGTFTIQRGATLAIKNGGGNTMSVRGIIAGDGHVNIVAHGTTFAGDQSNTLAGTFNVGGSRGATILARDKGADVVVGPLVMRSNGTLRWAQDDQIADTVPLTFDGDLPTLALNGHREKMGTLNLQSDGRIDLGEKVGRLIFADSSAVKWSPEKVLLIENGGHGRSTIQFISNKNNGGNEARAGLTAAQLNRIGFVDPVGFAPGTYTARLDDQGTLLPTGELVKPVGLPISLADDARAKRNALYDVPGLARLTGKQTPLRKGQVIAVFGDSITWGGGYLKLIIDAMRNGEGTAKLGIHVINHGVNGGGVLTIRDGDNTKAHAGNTKPEPFAKTIAEDKADVAVVFVGVNDVWWRKTTPEDFEKAMRDLVAQARANQTIPVLATLAIFKETVGLRNSKCDQFANITRQVARDTDTTLVDLRAAFMACMENESITIRPGGSWTSDGKLLAHDGVHTNARGNEILANLIAQGVFEALQK